MIKNERQYGITRDQAENFERAVKAMEDSTPPPGVHPAMHAASLEAMKIQAQDLRGQMQEYDRNQVRGLWMFGLKIVVGLAIVALIILVLAYTAIPPVPKGL